MSTKIKYNNSTILEFESGTAILPVNGKQMASDIEVIVEKPQLYAPTITIDGDILTIAENADNGVFTTSYDLCIDGSLVGNYTSTTIDLTTFEFTEGVYLISAKAKGINFIDSIESEAIEYIVYASNFILSDGSIYLTSDGLIFNTKEE